MDISMADPGPSNPSRRDKKRKEKGTRPISQASSAAGPSSAPQEALEVEQRRAAKKAERQQRKKAAADTKGKDHEWECVPIAKTAVSAVPPIWSSDGRFYFTVSQTSIHIHSAVAPAYERLSTIGHGQNGHARAITALLNHPTNPMQIITASDDGTVKVWDWVEGRLVRTLPFAIGGRVYQIAIGQVVGKWVVFANAGLPKENHDSSKQGSGYYLNFRVLRLALTPTTDADRRPQHVGKLSNTPTSLVISPKFTYLVALSNNKAHTYRLPTSIHHETWKPTCVKFVSDQNFTCGAFAPERVIAGRSDEEWFATGDVKGVIRLWHGLTAAFRQIDAATAAQSGVNDPGKVFPDTEKRLPTTSLHWHAHAVGAIAFTPSGAQLLSVGEESVLVQWHLASGKKEYIPRLGGRPLISLAVKAGSRGIEEEYWMKLVDGGVVRVGAASGSVTTIGQAVRLDPLRPQGDINVPYPITIHPPTRAVVLPSSHSSTLQFVDPSSSSVLFDLEVAPSNRVSRRDDKELEPVSVEHVAFNDAIENGHDRWMATVEGRKGDELEGGGLVKNLKIWKWQNDKYSISTQFPRPHGSSDVTKVVFSTSTSVASSSSGSAAQPYLLTASADGTAKLWQVRQVKKLEAGKGTKKAATFELFWSTRATFSYRSMKILDAVFSPDSTILALAHGSVVTLWDVEKNVLLKALDGALSDVRQVGFVGNDGRYLAASAGSRGIAVWDLLSCDVVWANVLAPCHKLITSQDLPVFVAAHEPADGKTVFSVHKPTSTNPVRSVKAKGKINRLVLLPFSGAASSKDLRFAGISQSGEIFRFGDDISKDAVVGSNAIRSAGEKGVSIWQEMFGKDAFLEIEDSYESEETGPLGSVAEKRSGNPVEIFEGASHTLPPVSLLFDAFLESILVPKSSGLGDVEEAKILYEVEDTIEPLQSTRQQKGRDVNEEEIDELEVFFRDVLKTVDTSKKRNGKEKVNGHVLPNGTDANLATPQPKAIATPSKSPKTPARKVADEEEDAEEVLASTDSKGTKRGKKRKAPKEA